MIDLYVCGGLYAPDQCPHVPNDIVTPRYLLFCFQQMNKDLANCSDATQAVES